FFTRILCTCLLHICSVAKPGPLAGYATLTIPVGIADHCARPDHPRGWSSWRRTFSLAHFSPPVDCRPCHLLSGLEPLPRSAFSLGVSGSYDPHPCHRLQSDHVPAAVARIQGRGRSLAAVGSSGIARRQRDQPARDGLGGRRSL